MPEMGRVVIITGAASGIGKACAELFAAEDYAVVLADRDTKNGQALAQRLGPRAAFVLLDIADEASVQACVDFAVTTFGRIDCAVNCAGIGGVTSPAHIYPSDKWQLVQRIDSDGVFYFCKALVAYWLTQEPRVVREADEEWGLEAVKQRGAIVNIASINAHLASNGMSALAAAKHAALGISKNFAYEYVDHGIRVNTVSPGCVLTPIMQAPGFDFNKVAHLYIANQAIKRFAHPAEIAPACLYLCSDEASFTTGCDMKLDCGWSAH